MKRRRPLHELKIRTCRSMHRCCVCLGNISWGYRYHDGGWPRRAHLACAEEARRNPKLEHSREQLARLDEAAHAKARARPSSPILPVPVRVESFFDND